MTKVVPSPATFAAIQVFDRALLRQRRRKAAKNFHQYDFLFGWAEKQILESLRLITRPFHDILIIGGRRSEGFYAALRELYGTQCRLSVYDLDTAHHHAPLKDAYTLVTGDEEFLPFAPQSFDLVISNLNFHAVNDLPGQLIQIRRILKPDGLLTASLLGGETLFELRDSLTQAELAIKGGVSPRIHPFATKQDMGGLMQRAGYALPVIDSDILTVTYDTAFALMRDLRGMGESNIIRARNRKNPGKAVFFEAARHYAAHHTEKNSSRIEASFEIIFLHGWAPHESQQKPLKPGSAQLRMADALDTEENLLPFRPDRPDQ